MESLAEKYHIQTDVRGFLFWSGLFILSPNVHHWLFSEDVCQIHSLSGQVQLLWYCILNIPWGWMSIRRSIFSICRKSAQPWVVLLMGPKWQDYILEVELARWECGSPSTESKPRTQTAFKGHWEEIRSSLRRAREMHLMSYKLYTVPHDPDLFWFMLQASTESSQDSFVLKGLVTQEF